MLWISGRGLSKEHGLIFQFYFRSEGENRGVKRSLCRSLIKCPNSDLCNIG